MTALSTAIKKSRASVEREDSADNEAWLNEPLSVVVHLAFAFDIGDEIDLERARQMLQGELGQLPRRRRTPESIGYRPAPIRVPLEPVGLQPAGRGRPGAESESRADHLRFRRDLAGRAVPLAGDALRALATGRCARRAGRRSMRRHVSFLAPGSSGCARRSMTFR